MTIRDDAAAIADDIAELPHAIHREPEIGVELPMTQRKVLDALAARRRSGSGTAGPRGKPSRT